MNPPFRKIYYPYLYYSYSLKIPTSKTHLKFMPQCMPNGEPALVVATCYPLELNLLAAKISQHSGEIGVSVLLPVNFVTSKVIVHKISYSKNQYRVKANMEFCSKS